MLPLPIVFIYNNTFPPAISYRYERYCTHQRLEGSEHMPEDVEVIEVCASRHRPRISSRLTKLRKQLTGGRRAQREEFECILEIANDIAEQDPHALPALIRLIGRSAQARAITTVLRHPQDAADCGYDYGEVLFDISKPLTAKGLR